MGFTPSSAMRWHGLGKGDLLILPLAVTGKTAGPRVTRMRELALPHTIFDTRERGPYTLPGQHIRADSIVGGGAPVSQP